MITFWAGSQEVNLYKDMHLRHRHDVRRHVFLCDHPGKLHRRRGAGAGVDRHAAGGPGRAGVRGPSQGAPVGASASAAV